MKYPPLRIVGYRCRPLYARKTWRVIPKECWGGRPKLDPGPKSDPEVFATQKWPTWVIFGSRHNPLSKIADFTKLWERCVGKFWRCNKVRFVDIWLYSILRDGLQSFFLIKVDLGKRKNTKMESAAIVVAEKSGFPNGVDSWNRPTWKVKKESFWVNFGIGFLHEVNKYALQGKLQ